MRQSLVLGSHSSHSEGFPTYLANVFNWLFDGALGVRFFFVLSGFLITLLMLRERGLTGHFSLKLFWMRRSLRILPVYYLHLAVLWLVQQQTAFSMSPGEWFRAITFTYNYGAAQWLPAHVWSLCVEEQFYLLWPVMFALVGARKNALMAVLLAVLVSSASGRIVGYFWSESVLFGWRSLLVNMDALGIGCAAAYFAFYLGGEIKQSLYCVLALLIAAGLILVPYVLSRLHLAGVVTVPLGPAMQAAGFAIVMLLSIVYRQHWSTSWLQWQVAVQLGTLSYSVYIWQQLFCSHAATFGIKKAWFLTFPMWIFLTICVAMISFYLVERPFLSWKGRLGGKRFV